jgi:hypothetical protein
MIDHALDCPSVEFTSCLEFQGDCARTGLHRGERVAARGPQSGRARRARTAAATISSGTPIEAGEGSVSDTRPADSASAKSTASA